MELSQRSYSEKNLLLRMLRYPDQAQNVSLSVWDRLLPCARQESVLASLYAQIIQHNILNKIPAQVHPHLQAAAALSAQRMRQMQWEVNRIQRALRALDVPIVILKGAAYILSDFDFAHGRLLSDVDILVPKDRLDAVEQQLRAHHWVTDKTDPYDQNYYRRWMHELPPMRHALRNTIIDVHHTILPLTSRLQPDPSLLFRDARAVADGLYVLAPTDMLLHSAVHTFYDGECRHLLRDLFDLHSLMVQFDREPDFWILLPQRARQLGLQRPLYYALRYCKRFMETPIPAEVMSQLCSAAPCAPVQRLMDVLITRVLLSQRRGVAQWMLFIRSHWLRMPPLLLTRHLLIKSFKRLQWRIGYNDQLAG